MKSTKARKKPYILRVYNRTSTSLDLIQVEEFRSERRARRYWERHVGQCCGWFVSTIEHDGKVYNATEWFTQTQTQQPSRPDE